MSEVKVFRVTGEVMKQKFFIPMSFSQEIKAAKEEHKSDRSHVVL